MFEAKLFSLPANCLFRIAGIDAERYLHGRITQNVKGLALGTAAKSLVLSPQGKIQGQFLIFRKSKDSFLLISDELKDVEEFKRSILQFKVADQLELENLASTHLLFSLQGEDAGKLLAEKNLSFAGLNLEVIEHTRTKNLSVDLIVEAKDSQKFEELFKDLQKGSAEELESLRIEAGLPRMGKELTDKISVADIPLEHLVSFNKGCYAGQEVVEMSIARGRPNRKLISAKSNNKISLEDKICLEDGTECGFVTSLAYLVDKKVCVLLAFIKTSVDQNAALFIRDTQLELI